MVSRNFRSVVSRVFRVYWGFWKCIKGGSEDFEEFEGVAETLGGSMGVTGSSQTVSEAVEKVCRGFDFFFLCYLCLCLFQHEQVDRMLPPPCSVNNSLKVDSISYTNRQALGDALWNKIWTLKIPSILEAKATSHYKSHHSSL